MHLPRETDCPDSFSADACLFQHRLNTRHNRLPPFTWILLRPEWFWCLKRMRI